MKNWCEDQEIEGPKHEGHVSLGKPSEWTMVQLEKWGKGSALICQLLGAQERAG